MIAQLFFPKDMKRLVYQLRKESNLNKNALMRIEMRILLTYLLFGGFTCAVAAAIKIEYGTTEAIISFSIGAFILIIITPHLAKHYIRLSYLFTVGKYTTSTKIVFKKYRGALFLHEAWDIEYKYLVGGKEYSSSIRWVPRNQLEQNEINAEQIKIAYHPEKPADSVPVLSRLNRRYKLSSARRK